jgi:hypothetical protein
VREITTNIEIDAPPERVWQILTDFSEYPEWNPFVRSIEGELKLGVQLEATIHPPGKKPMKFRPRVVTLEPNRELRWEGYLLFPGLFDGEHAQVIESRGDDRVRFLHYELFRGLLVAPLLRMNGKSIRRGFEEMNLALKERAERG